MTGDVAVCKEDLDITQSRKYGVVDWIDSDVLSYKSWIVGKVPCSWMTLSRKISLTGKQSETTLKVLLTSYVIACFVE